MSTLTAGQSLVQLPLGAEQAIAVLGLRWQPMQSLQPDKKANQQRSQSTPYDHWVPHQVGEQMQAGLATLPPDTAQCYYSASLHLIEQLGAAWVAIVQLPNHAYGLIGVAKGQVVSGCELVLATVEETLKQFTLYQALFQWATIYAPEPLKLTGSQPLALETLLASCCPQAAYQLQAVTSHHPTPVQWRRYALLGGGLLCGIAAASYLYTQHRSALQLAQQRLRQAQRQQQAAKSLPVWRQHPPAKLLLEHCRQTINRYPLFLGGWRLESAHCDRHSAQASYRWQAPHTVKSLLAALRAYPGQYQFASGGKVVQLQQAVDLPKNRPPEPLPSLLTVANGILQPLEQGSATGRIDDLLSKPKSSAAFELNSDQQPLALLQQLPLAGVVIHSLQTTIHPNGRLHWKCSGTLYGQ